MTATVPIISVVMPVYNGLPFLRESVGSILGQTFTDFEFVILDDASTDGSKEVLRECARRDGRIRLVEGATRLGLCGSSNAVVSEARAAVVARMDADDVSHPDRLLKQWAVMDGRPDVAVVGTLSVGIDETGREVRPRDRWRLVRRSEYLPFPHGSAMFRRSAFDAVGGYTREAEGGEDQDLFSRMKARGSVVTLPDILYRYRYHSRNATLVNATRAVEQSQAKNGDALPALYMLGAMRLWAGNPPMLLEPILARKMSPWNLRTAAILASAVLGDVSPPGLRFLLRSAIRARDLLASLRVKDGRSYEWRTR